MTPDLLNLNATLDQKRQELVRLESELKAAQKQRLAQLATENGFESTDSLIFALREFATSSMQKFLDGYISNTIGKSVNYPMASKRIGRKKRVVVTDSMRTQMVKDIKRGLKSARAIAEELGVSTSTVNNLKQKLGLTRSRIVSR